MKLSQDFLHRNKEKIKLGLHRTQKVHKVKRFSENAPQKVSNFNFQIFLKKFKTFLKKFFKIKL